MFGKSDEWQSKGNKFLKILEAYHIDEDIMVQWSGANWNNPSEAKDKLLFIAALLTKKISSMFCEPLKFEAVYRALGNYALNHVLGGSKGYQF